MPDSTTDKHIASDSTTVPPVGPIIKFRVEEYTFARLTRELVEYEQKFALSSLEMFSQYAHGGLDEKMEEWLDLFILYLGTGEIKRLSCS